MSYRNPQQVVDTQTGQHYRNLQASISNTFDKVADASRLEQDRIRKEQEKVQLKLEKEAEQAKKDSIDIMRRDVNASAKIQGYLNDSAVAMGTAGSKELDRNVTRMAELMTKGTTDPNETIFLKNMTRLPEDLASATSLVNSLISSSKEDLGVNIGEMGGASLTNTSKARNFALILSNLKEGTSSFSTDPSGADGNKITFTVTPKDGGESVSYTYAQLKELQQGGGSIIQKIPDVTVDYDQSFKAANIVNNKGILQEDFLGAVGPSEPDPNNPKKTRRFRQVDAEKVKASLYPGAKQTIGAMSKSDPNGEVNLYNFYALRQKPPIDLLDMGTPLSTGDNSQTELLEKMYVDHQYNREAVNFKKVLASTEEVEELDTDELSAEGYFKILQDPEEALQLVGNPGESSFNSKTNIISLKQKTDQVKTTKEGDIETKEPVYENITFDLNTKKGGQDYVNAMVGQLEGLRGAANQDKVLAIKRMVAKFFDSTQSAKAQEYNKKNKKGTGSLDEVNK